MKYIRFIIILFSLIGIGVFAQGGIKYVSPAKENLRQEPNGDKIGELVSGVKVEVLERKDKWVKVQCTGWIWEQSLTDDQTSVDGFKVRASHILLSSESEARDILNQLNQGASFEDLASKHSIDVSSGPKGGDLGMFGRGDFLPEFEQAAFQLNVGEVSGIVKSNLGYHIIKRIE